MVEIPEVMRSKETFLFLGLTEGMAATLWERWLQITPDDRGPDGPISFLSLAENLITCHDDDVWCVHEPWEKFITSLGFANEVAEAICDPEYHSIRFTESAKFWLLDTLQLRWRSLEELHDMSRLRLRKVQSNADPRLTTRGGEIKG